MYILYPKGEKNAIKYNTQDANLIFNMGSLHITF